MNTNADNRDEEFDEEFTSIMLQLGYSGNSIRQMLELYHRTKDMSEEELMAELSKILINTE